MIEAKESTFKPSIFIKMLIGYIYFMQGVYLSIAGSIIYIYPIFPSPDVLSSFSIASLPFSLKFVTAPIVEKYTSHSYGPRKFWISLSLFATSLLTFPLSLVAHDQQNYMLTIGLLFVIIIFISMGDVAIDAASVKQLEDPVLAGYLQACMQPIGVIFGSFFIIKSVNPTFWTFVGIDGPLCSTQTLLTIISIIGIIIAFVIHFKYKERMTQEQKQDQIPEFKTIFKYYLHFVRPKYSLFRHVIYFLVIFQGVKFFTINYGTQAIYRGFPKQNLSELQNLCLAVAFIINTILSKIIDQQKTYLFIPYLYVTELIVYSAVYYADNFDSTVVVCVVFFIKIMAYVKFLIHSTLCNGFGHSKFAGLCLTTLASFVNLGNNPWLQLKLNGLFGYYSSVGGGLIYAWVIALILKFFIDWMRKGEPETHSVEHQKKN